MSQLEDATARLKHYFSKVSDEQFSRDILTHAPDLIESRQLQNTGELQEVKMNQLMLFNPQSSPLPLDAYLACALTGLSHEQRQLISLVSDTISLVCTDVGINLYEPRKNTDPAYNPDISASDVFKLDRDRVLSSDLVIHLCHYPSTGSGEELDFAYNALVPIILVTHGDSRISRMVSGIPSFKVQLNYTEPEELRPNLKDTLLAVRPILEERKMAFASYDTNMIGQRIRQRREELVLSREEIASRVPLLTAESLRHIEESTDRVSNPSLIRLRQIAAVLRTTVADLVEPDLGEHSVRLLEDWLEGRSAARHGMSPDDRNRVIRRILYRVMDSLEERPE